MDRTPLRELSREMVVRDFAKRGDATDIPDLEAARGLEAPRRTTP